MILQVENNLDKLSTTLYSYTSNTLSAGGTVIPVRNINSFINQYAIQVGKTGEEQSEILIISGVPSGTALNTSGTIRFDHPLDTPVFSIHFDKIIFKRSTDGTAGTATALTNGTVAITPDSLYTEFNDSSGASSYAYKTQFYNSVSGHLSSESDWFIPGGPSFYSLQRLRDRGKRNLYNDGFIKDDLTIDEWINEWVEQMTNAAIKVNQGYALGTASYPFGTAGIGTITASLFKHANKVEITYDGVDYVASNEIKVNEYSQNDVFSGAAPRHSWIGNTNFKILPASSGGTALFTLSQLFTPLTDDADELPQFLKGYTTGCIEYILYRAYDLDQKDTIADKHYGRFLSQKSDFIAEVTPRDQTGVKTIQFLDSLSGMSDDVTLDTEYFI